MDTFVNVFPNYRIHRDIRRTAMKKQFQYPPIKLEGGPIHQINRLYTHKKDHMKVYSEEMYKIQSIKRDL